MPNEQLMGGIPRSLAVEPILQHLYGRLEEGDCIEFMRLELGVDFAWGMWLRELVWDLVETGVLTRVRERPRRTPWDGYGPPYYRLSAGVWLQLVREESECQT